MPQTLWQIVNHPQSCYGRPNRDVQLLAKHGLSCCSLLTRIEAEHMLSIYLHSFPGKFKGSSLASNGSRRKAHRHIGLPAKVMPVEGDGGVVEQRVLVKVAVEHGNCPSSALQPSAPDLRPTFKSISGQPLHVIGCDHVCRGRRFTCAALLMYLAAGLQLQPIKI